jgi:multiple sugar transport system permease protein
MDRLFRYQSLTKENYTMSTSTLPNGARPTALQRWGVFSRRIFGDMGSLGYLLRLMVLLVFAIYFGLPLLWLLLAPSKDQFDINSLNPLAFGNWATVLKSWNNINLYSNGEIWLWFRNSVLYAVSSLAIGLAISIPAGYMLAVARFAGRYLLLWLTLITMLLPPSAMVLPLFLELNLVHLVNTMWAVILPASFFPFGVYLSYVYYSSNLPTDLIDAARVDGCSELDLFLHVALPLAKPLLGLLAFISFNANWNNFFGPYVLLNNDKLFNLPVGLQTMIAGTSAIRPGFNTTPGLLKFQQADAAMAGLVMILPVVIVFLLSQRYVVAGAFTGSVKG